jgi:hypothetical protein
MPATIINHAEAPTKKEFGKAQLAITKVAGLQVTEICLGVGFDWPSMVGANLPGCPTWCPATHCGYLKSGTMTMTFEDGSPEVVINAGDTYHISPGHRPIISDVDAVMVEFIQDPAAQKRDHSGRQKEND